MKLDQNTKKFNYVSLSMIFLLQIIDNFVRDKNIAISELNAAKNIGLLLVGLMFLYEIYRLREFEDNYSAYFGDELRHIFILAASFLLLSIFYMIKNNGCFFETFVGIFKIIMPAVMAYAVINVMNVQDIYKIMSILLILSFIAYLISILDIITISNIKQINFMTSNSPFESNFFSPTAMAFCLFFCFYRKNTFFTVMSVFFTIMTFKRIMILYAIFLLFVGKIIQKKTISDKAVFIFGTAFLALSVFYIRLMSGKIPDIINEFIGIDVNAFAMGRSYFMRVIIRDFKSFGYMSSTINYRSMEMDIPMIYTEMGILSVIVLIYCFLNLVKNNMYNFLIIVFCLLELLTSHWLDIPYYWFVTYITIGCVTYHPDVVRLQRKKSRIKFVSKRNNLQK